MGGHGPAMYYSREGAGGGLPQGPSDSSSPRHHSLLGFVLWLLVAALVVRPVAMRRCLLLGGQGAPPLLDRVNGGLHIYPRQIKQRSIGIHRRWTRMYTHVPGKCRAASLGLCSPAGRQRGCGRTRRPGARWAGKLAAHRRPACTRARIA